MREHVKYKEGAAHGAIAAMKDGTGDCEDMTSLFIAFCRAEDIPARTVWVPGHCYPEFYLEDDKGEGHWFPCQAAGARQFGGITEDRPILQKGDNFKPLQGKGERQRYMAEFLYRLPNRHRRWKTPSEIRKRTAGGGTEVKDERRAAGVSRLRLGIGIK